MPRFRSRSQSIRPVNRVKHVIDVQQGGVAGTQNVNTLAVANDDPSLSAATQVETASIINGIYLKVEANATSSAALANFYIMIVKNPGNNLTFPNANTVGTSNNKKFVIHQEMVMFQQQTNSNPRTVFNGVIVIPKGYRRMGPDDRIQLYTFAPGVNTNQCVQCHYKEFR